MTTYVGWFGEPEKPNLLTCLDCWTGITYLHQIGQLPTRLNCRTKTSYYQALVGAWLHNVEMRYQILEQFLAWTWDYNSLVHAEFGKLEARVNWHDQQSSLQIAKKPVRCLSPLKRSTTTRYYSHQPLATRRQLLLGSYTTISHTSHLMTKVGCDVVHFSSEANPNSLDWKLLFSMSFHLGSYYIKLALSGIRNQESSLQHRRKNEQ